MAQTGYTPIQLYYSSTTTNVPLAANLSNGELAINITDGKLFYKDNANAVQVIGWKIVPATAGGTGLTSFAVGDLIYADTTTTLAKLPDVATGNALISGGVSTAPSWGKIGLTTHVSGTLPTTNGGTNLTSFTANGVMYASSSSVLATGSVLTFDGAQLTVNSVTVGRGGGAISSNTAIGTSALGANTTGNQQVCVGVSAGAALTTQVNNTFVGYQVGAAATGNRNIGVGTNVQGFYNSALYAVSGNDNVAIGPAAGSGITSGSTNVAIGATNGGNLSAGITGSCNVMIGWGVGASLTSGNNNTMVGAGRAGFA
jgi:hypothetical protein